VDDRAFFFGREKEIDKLYNMVFSTNLLLIYGPSGAGKTSLIQCGLASRFQDTDWHDIHVRWRGDINKSMRTVLKKHAVAEIAEDASTVAMVQSIYLDHFKPLFLVCGLAGHFDILLEDEEVTINKITDNISSAGHIQLSYLQVYLDYLYVERQRIGEGE